MGRGAAAEIQRSSPERFAEFLRPRERDALSEHWDFRVVWHEQRHAFLATRAGRDVGGASVTIAASLARLDWILVDADARRQGIGRLLLAAVEEVANYYNCHKVTLETFAGGPALSFFEAAGYKIEATLPQHTFKLDVAVLRKFLL